MIPMLDIKRELNDIGDEIKKAVNSSIEKTMFILGPNVKSFEENAAKYLGCKYAAAVASGTDALHLALRGAGIKEGDEVITSPFTFIATAEAIMYCGAKPVFVDVDKNTFNIDPTKIEKVITKNTKAILPVHLFGNPCEMGEIKKIASKHNVMVIEDCAQSFGASYENTKTGNIGIAGCFSFFPSKNLGCYGDGGLISTNDENIYKNIIALRNHGSFVRYYHEVIGYNSRLDDIQASILDVKLKYIDHFNTERREVAKLYKKYIGDILAYQKEYENAPNIYHQFTVVTDKRDKIMNVLKEHEIASAIYYPVPLHLQNAFKILGYKKGDFPVSEFLSENVLSFPVNPYLEEEEIMVIANVVKSAF